MSVGVIRFKRWCTDIVTFGCSVYAPFPLKNSLYCFELIQHCPHIPTFSCCCHRRPFIHTYSTEHHPPMSRLNHWKQNTPNQRSPHHLFTSADPHSAGYKLHSPPLHHAATVWVSDHSHHTDRRPSSDLSSGPGPCWANTPGNPTWTKCWRWR